MRLCAICDEPLHPTAVSYCSNKCRHLGQNIRRAALLREDVLGPAIINNANDLYRLRRANLRHLLDLKRAGHSPSRTELRMKKLA